jgi:hypothetical protein
MLFRYLTLVLFDLLVVGPFAIKIVQIGRWPTGFLGPLRGAAQGWFLGICWLL